MPKVTQESSSNIRRSRICTIKQLETKLTAVNVQNGICNYNAHRNFLNWKWYNLEMTLLNMC